MITITKVRETQHVKNNNCTDYYTISKDARGREHYSYSLSRGRYIDIKPSELEEASTSEAVCVVRKNRGYDVRRD